MIRIKRLYGSLTDYHDVQERAEMVWGEVIRPPRQGRPFQFPASGMRHAQK